MAHIDFRVKPHTIKPGVNTVEILFDNQTVLRHLSA